MMTDKICKIFDQSSQFKSLNDYIEREKLIQEELENKSNEEICRFLNSAMDRLIDTPVNERGGLIAITGFYYQMLVVIEYLIKMKQGYWDYVAVELHDDIVVIKENNIRFIQVKTSNVLSCNVTDKPAASIYYRETKSVKIKGAKEKKDCKISNSWVDKLILKSKNFKKDEGFNTEFELLTNYVITDTKKVKIDKYVNKSTEKNIDSSDYLYMKISESSYIQDDNIDEYVLVDYERVCGEKLEELLSRLHIDNKQNSLNNIDKYLDSICQQIGTEIGGVYVSNEDVNWIIGQLFALCNVNVQNRQLVINKNQVESLFLEIYNRALIGAEKLVEEEGTRSLVNRVYESLHYNYAEMEQYEVIEKIMLDYKCYLIEWINTNGGVNKIINRYFSATEISNNHVGMQQRDKENIIEELIKIPIILILIYETDVLYTDNCNLLTKNINNGKYLSLSLLRLARGKIKIDDIKSLVNNLGVETILTLTMSEDLKIIVQGYLDRTFLTTKKFELEDFDNEITLLEEDTSIKKVKQVVSLIPGEHLKELLENQLVEEAWNIDDLKQLWEEILEEKENAS